MAYDVKIAKYPVEFPHETEWSVLIIGENMDDLRDFFFSPGEYLQAVQGQNFPSADAAWEIHNNVHITCSPFDLQTEADQQQLARAAPAGSPYMEALTSLPAAGTGEGWIETFGLQPRLNPPLVERLYSAALRTFTAGHYQMEFVLKTGSIDILYFIPKSDEDADADRVTRLSTSAITLTFLESPTLAHYHFDLTIKAQGEGKPTKREIAQARADVAFDIMVNPRRLTHIVAGADFHKVGAKFDDNSPVATVTALATDNGNPQIMWHGNVPIALSDVMLIPTADESDSCYCIQGAMMKTDDGEESYYLVNMDGKFYQICPY